MATRCSARRCSISAAIRSCSGTTAKSPSSFDLALRAVAERPGHAARPCPRPRRQEELERHGQQYSSAVLAQDPDRADILVLRASRVTLWAARQELWRNIARALEVQPASRSPRRTRHNGVRSRRPDRRPCRLGTGRARCAQWRRRRRGPRPSGRSRRRARRKIQQGFQLILAHASTWPSPTLRGEGRGSLGYVRLFGASASASPEA